MNELTAHQVSTISFIILIGLYIGYIIKIFPPGRAEKALQAGMLWMVLTLIFEFGFGLLRGHSLKNLFADYNIMKGRLWILIPTWLLIAPYIFHRLYNSL